MEEIRWKQRDHMNLLVLRRIQMKCCCKLKRNEDYNELPRQSFINVFFIFIDFFFFCSIDSAQEQVFAYEYLNEIYSALYFPTFKEPKKANYRTHIYSNFRISNIYFICHILYIKL